MSRWQTYSATYKQYYQDNKEAILQKNQDWKMANPAKFLYNSARQRAKKAEIPFELVPEDIVIPNQCPYLQVPLEFGTDYAPSVDRIDNSQGYIPGNIQVISMRANRMKNNATQAELILFAKAVLKRPEIDRKTLTTWNKEPLKNECNCNGWYIAGQCGTNCSKS